MRHGPRQGDGYESESAGVRESQRHLEHKVEIGCGQEEEAENRREGPLQHGEPSVAHGLQHAILARAGGELVCCHRMRDELHGDANRYQH